MKGKKNKEANSRFSRGRTHIFKSRREREREERGERKLTWLGVNGSLRFAPSGERREEREMKRDRERERERERQGRERESAGT